MGRRRPALRAAVRLGVEVVQIDAAAGQGAPPEGVVERLPEPSEPQGPEAWRELAARLPAPERIAAVVGLTEAAVVPAARLREALGLPGLPVATALRCTDKLHMKQAVRNAGLPCADFVACEPSTRPDELAARLGLPVVLKPRASSGGRGVLVAQRPEELPDPLPVDHLAERLVRGTEMSVETLLAGGRLLFTNPTEYIVPRQANLVPALLEPVTRERVLALNEAALAALGVNRGMTHLELYLTPQGVVFGELAARPPGGHIMRLVELAYGFDPWLAWLRVQLGEQPELPARAPGCAAVWVLHPGPGRVRAVSGVEAARRLPGVERVHLRVGPGDRVGPRLGAGQEVGHVLVRGPDRQETARRLERAQARLRIQMEPEAATRQFG